MPTVCILEKEGRLDSLVGGILDFDGPGVVGSTSHRGPSPWEDARDDTKVGGSRFSQVLDVLSSIGLSDSLLRMIDRRQRLDAIIVYGGMLLAVLLVLLIWWFFKA